MNQFKAGFLRKIQFPLLMALGALPLALFIASFYDMNVWGCVGTAAVAFVLLAALCLALPGKARLPAGILSAGAILALGWLVLPVREHVWTALIPLLYAFFLLYTLPMAAWPREKEIPLFWIAAGVFCHAAVQALAVLGRRAGLLPGLVRAAAGLPGCLIAFLALALLSLNRAAVESAGMGRHSVPRAMRIRNVLLTLGLLILTAGLSCLLWVARALSFLWTLCKQGIFRLVQWILLLFPDRPASGTGGLGGSAADDLSGLPPAGEPSLIFVILERIFMALALAAVAVGLFFVLKFLIIRIRRFIRYLQNRLRRFAALAGEDYVDEVTDTRDGAASRASSLPRRLGVYLGGGRLSPGQRVRRRYLQLRLRHRDWQPGSTARETLPPDAAGLYERARYSGRELTEEEARDFDRAVRKM